MRESLSNVLLFIVIPSSSNSLSSVDILPSRAFVASVNDIQRNNQCVLLSHLW